MQEFHGEETSAKIEQEGQRQEWNEINVDFDF